MSELELDDCGCCEDKPQEAPALYNPPGLLALAYRLDTQARFKARMLAGIAQHKLDDGSRPLGKLTTRNADDPSIALVDAAATVLDVLCFYQERIANEGYLRTSVERLSVLKLARSIGYELSPGVAASSYLAFDLETAPGSPERVTLDRGLKVQSLPGPGEQVQIFETVESLKAFPEWNVLRPQQSELRNPRFGDIYVYLSGTTNLRQGDPLLIVGAERISDPGSERWEFRRVLELENDAAKSYTRVRLSEPLGSRLPTVRPPEQGPRVYALRLRVSVFGYNAPDWKVMPLNLKLSYLGLPENNSPLDPPILDWPDFTIAAVSDPPPDSTAGTGLYGEYFDDKAFKERRFSRTDPSVDFDWGTGSPDSALEADSFSVRWTGWIKPTRTGIYTFATSSDDGVRLWVKGQLLINQWILQGATKHTSTEIKLEADQKYDLKLEYFENGGGAVIRLFWQPPGQAEAIIPTAQLYPRDVHSLHLDAVYSQITRDSWVALATPEYTELYRVMQVGEDSRTGFTLSSKTTKLVLQGEGLRDHFNEKLRELSVFAQSEELPVAQTPLKQRYAVGTANIRLEEPALTPLSGNEIVLDRLVGGLEKGKALIVSGKVMRLRLVDNEPSLRKLVSLEDSTITRSLLLGESLRVLAAPTPQGIKVRWLLEDAEGFVGEIVADRNDFRLMPALDADPEVSEVAFLADPLEPLDKTYTRLKLQKSLLNLFDRATVQIRANVLKATHGETKQEVLGSGQAGQAFQRFALKQKPLTYVSASTLMGHESSLELRVNDILWEEVSSLYQQPAKAQVYATHIADDGTAAVQFGDGLMGARLPSGLENVQVSYRVGTGIAGMVKARQLSLLLTRPLGVKGVSNPLAPSGAADPETLARARSNAPLTVLTLGRVVSLRDYQNFARAFAGIGKAQAVELRRGELRLVHITVAAVNGGAVLPDADLYKNLEAAIRAQSDTHQSFVLESFTARAFNLAAKLRIDPRYLAETVLPVVQLALLEAFGFEARGFGQGVTGSEAISVIQAVEGVVSADLDFLYFKGSPKSLPTNFRLSARIARWSGNYTLPAELLTLNPGGVELLAVKP